MDTNFIVEYVIDFIISKVDLANALGLIGGIFYVMSVTLRTMIPLRIAAIASNILFMGYGLLAKALPTFFMYAVLLPINCFRLYQDLAIGEAREGCFAGRFEHGLAQAVHDPRNFKAGDTLFHKGDTADAMYYTGTVNSWSRKLTSNCRPAGLLASSAFSAGKRRTATVEFIEDGQVLFILYEGARIVFSGSGFWILFPEAHQRAVAAEYRAA